MNITITGCKLTPSWETLQQAVREARGDEGRFTRINRRDKGVNYRAPGVYDLDYTTNGDVIPITLTVEG